MIFCRCQDFPRCARVRFSWHARRFLGCSSWSRRRSSAWRSSRVPSPARPRIGQHSPAHGMRRRSPSAGTSAIGARHAGRAPRLTRRRAGKSRSTRKASSLRCRAPVEPFAPMNVGSRFHPARARRTRSRRDLGKRSARARRTILVRPRSSRRSRRPTIRFRSTRRVNTNFESKARTARRACADRATSSSRNVRAKLPEPSGPVRRVRCSLNQPPSPHLPLLPPRCPYLPGRYRRRGQTPRRDARSRELPLVSK